MKGWIVSIVCVIVLGILLEIVLPKGKMAKYVKGTFSLLVIFVVVSPLPKLVRKEWKFDFSSTWNTVNSALLEDTQDAREKEREEDLRDYLALFGFDCDIKIESDEYGLDTKSIEVTLYGNGDKTAEILELVANHQNVSKTSIRLILKKEREKDVKI